MSPCAAVAASATATWSPAIASGAWLVAEDWTSGNPPLPAGTGVDDPDYLHAREYKPWLGRFLSTDPKRGSARPRSPQSFNRYSYGLGNPLKMVDPDGKEALTFTITTHIQAPKVFAPVPGFPPLQAFAGGMKTSQTFTMETSAAKASNPIVSRTSSVGSTRRMSVLGSREIDSASASSRGVVLGGGRDSSGNAHAFAGVVSGNPLHATAPPITLGLLISAPEGGSSFTVMGGFGGYPSLDITATNESGQTISVYQSTESLEVWGPFDLFPRLADQAIQLQCDFVTGCGDLSRE
jgi:RHS repeat-associated protein